MCCDNCGKKDDKYFEAEGDKLCRVCIEGWIKYQSECFSKLTRDVYRFNEEMEKRNLRSRAMMVHDSIMVDLVEGERKELMTILEELGLQEELNEILL